MSNTETNSVVSPSDDRLGNRKVATADLETDPFKAGRLPKVFAAGWCDGGATQTMWGKQGKVLKWLVGKIKNHNGLVYFHNGGKFDFLGFIVKYHGKELYGERARIINGRIVQCRMGRSEVRDSYAILPAKLGSYDKGEIDYERFESDKRELYKGEILAYLRRDVESLRELVVTFLKLHGTRPLTAASAGFSHLRSLGYDTDSLSIYQDAKFRKFYFGGRVAAFKPGIHDGSFNLYDIKSAYPHAMCHAHAIGSEFEFLVLKPQEVVGSDFILFEGEGGGHLLSRKGSKKDQYHCTGWEYLALPEEVRAGGKIVYVERCRKLGDFIRYVVHWFAVKQKAELDGDLATRHIAKIMLNSAYGKFAQNPEKYRDHFFMPAQEPVARGFEVGYLDDANEICIWECPSQSPKRYYNVATAASITGLVRARLLKAIHETAPYYCDTDSIICDGDRAPAGVGSSLGEWGLELQGDRLCIAGKKLYALRVLPKYCATPKEAKKKGYWWDQKDERGWKMATKGVRLSPDELRRVCLGETVRWTNDAPTYSIHDSECNFISRDIKMTA
jgi:hypothetical protein